MSTKPVRLRLSRRKGFDLQALSQATNGLPAANVARPGKWGNPWKVGDQDVLGLDGGKFEELRAEGGVAKVEIKNVTAEYAVERYRVLIKAGGETTFKKIRTDLRGKNLACWCRHGDPCHADVLLEIANG